MLSVLDFDFSRAPNKDTLSENDRRPGATSMPAQPASTMKWTGAHEFGNKVLTDLPSHGSIVASVIARWAMIETYLGATFAVLIGAKEPAAMSMYLATRSFEVQRDLLQAAVDELMAMKYAQMFKSCLVVINRAAQHRHHFAHWIWGASLDPNLSALLLVDPKNFLKLSAAQTKYWRHNRTKSSIEYAGPVEFMAKAPKLSLEHVFVYRTKELKEALHEVERAYRIAQALRELVSSPTVRKRVIYKWLDSESDIHQQLEKNTPKRRAPRE